MLLLKIMEEEVKSQGKVKTKSQLVLGTNYYLDKITVEKNINGEGAFWAPTHVHSKNKYGYYRSTCE